MPNGQPPIEKPEVHKVPTRWEIFPFPVPVTDPFKADLKAWQSSQTYWQAEEKDRQQRLSRIEPGMGDVDLPWWAELPTQAVKGLVGMPLFAPEGPSEFDVAKKDYEEAVRELGRSLFFTNLYASIPLLVQSGTITSFDDYTKIVDIPRSVLSNADLQIARDAVSRLVEETPATETEEALPDFLGITEEEKAAVEQFLKPVVITPKPMHRYSVDEIVKAFTTSFVPKLPEGMTDEELLSVMSVMGIPSDTLTQAIDIMDIITPLSDAASEQSANIEAVLAGLKEWEKPNLSVKERLLFAFLSPMQVAADIIMPYIEHVSYPLAGLAVYNVQQMIPGIQDLEAEYQRRVTEGANPYDAMRFAYKGWGTNWGGKLAIEILTDPITYTPGLLLSVPGKLLMKVGMKSLGRGMISFNTGLWNLLDIPFDAYKAIWAGRRVWGVPGIPKSSVQTVKAEMGEFSTDLFAVITKRNPAIGVAGRTLDMVSVDDISNALRYSLKVAKAAGPNAPEDEYVRFGRRLLSFAPIEPDDILAWSKTVGGKLTKDDIVYSLVDDFNNVLADTVDNFGNLAISAKRLAMIFQVEDSPLVLKRLAVHIKNYTWKQASRVDTVIELGKTAKVSPQLRMIDLLTSQQQRILQRTIGSSYYKARRFSGTMAALIGGVDRLEGAAWRIRLDRFLVRPIAEAYLGNPSYAIWNIGEGVFVSARAGIVPHRARSDDFLMMFKGMPGVDPPLMNAALRKGYAGDPSGLFGTAPGRARAGAYAIMPGMIPERVPWVGGKNYLEWLARKYLAISDEWGTGYRWNFLIRKMNKGLAEYSLDVGGKDINKEFAKLIVPAPKLTKAESLGLSQHTLQQEAFARASVSKESVLEMHNLLSQSSLMRAEQTKILNKATELSPQAKGIGEQLVQEGKFIKTEQSITDSSRVIADQALADLRQDSVRVADSFAALADGIAAQDIASADDLMRVFQHYEVMVDTASGLPSKLLAKTFVEADEIKALGKFGQLEKLWRTSRTEMESTIQNVNTSLEVTRTKVLENTHLLKPSERAALESIMDKASARDALRKDWLTRDGQLLDEFWAIPKSSRTAEVHAELRIVRNENWIEYRQERAVLGASEFQARRDYAQLYYKMPKPKFLKVNAEGRALASQDIANVMGCNVDALTNGILDVMTMQDKLYFIQMVKQQADRYPRYFRGVTEDKIGAAYDDMLRGMHFKPDQDIAAQKVLQQVEGIRQQMLHLRMTKSLSRSDERALRQWIDNVAGGMDDIIGEPLPKIDIALGAIGPDGQQVNASIAGKRAGYITYTESPEFLRISFIYTKPEATRKGVGTKLIQDAVDRATRSGKKLRTGALDDEGRMLFEGLAEKGIVKLTPYQDEFIVVAGRNFAKPPEGALVSKAEWEGIRQKASHAAHVDYYKVFTDYTNENIVDVVGKFIFPFWFYHKYRWFYLSRLFTRYPGMAAAWGKYYNYSDYGYAHIPNTDLEINPFVGSVFGTTFGLARHDFKSYYENLPFGLGEGLDFMQRRGFFPGPHIMLPIVITSIFSGRPPELGEVLPPFHRFGLNLLQASPIEAVRNSAKWLQDKVFHENFRDYYTATIISRMQSEAGGKLIDGQTGIDLWQKKQRGEKLTEEEQQVWDDASRETSWYNMLRSQFPIFRLRAEEMLEAYGEVTKIFEAQLGLTEEYQDWLWRHGMKPTDVVGGLPLDVRMTLDEMWQWKIWFGRGQILMPPNISSLYGLMNKYWSKVRSFQDDRLATQLETDTGFYAPTAEVHFSGREWRREYANTWSAYTARADGLEKDPEFADAIDAMTPEGQVRLAKELGFSAPVRHPLEEAIDLYFDIELERRTDPYTGQEEWDFLGFWLQREAVKMALTEEQRSDFEAYISRYQTPMERVFRDVTNRYLRGYRSVDRIVFETYDEDYQMLIKEFYVDTTSLERKDEIRAIQSPTTNRLLMSEFDSKRSDARAKLRLTSPQLDFWLYVFGYITKPKTPEALALVDAWEKDKSSIITGIEPTPVLERRIELLPEKETE